VGDGTADGTGEGETRVEVEAGQLLRLGLGLMECVELGGGHLAGVGDMKGIARVKRGDQMSKG
jgi:hypothetical protein